MLFHTLPQDCGDYSPVFARSSQPLDCACNALSPNTLHYGERCASCPFPIQKGGRKEELNSFRQKGERRAA